MSESAFQLAKTAFFLTGGGAKGCFQVGVMKRLIEKGIIPDRIYGTSTGALQAAGYAHVGMKRLEDLWLAIKSKSDVFGWNWWPHILTLGITLDGKYHMKPLWKKLKQMEASPREPGINCEAVVTRVSLATGAIEYVNYDHPEFLEAILASASVPFVARPVNGYVDGGVRDQMPIAHIEDILGEGFDRVIVISTNPIHINPEPWVMPKLFPLWAIIVRVADSILPCETWLDELLVVARLQKQGRPVEIYMPKNKWMDTEEYSPEKIRLGIQMGYEAEPTNIGGLL